MQMASQMVDIYTTGPWKVTSVETALSPWLVSHHQEHSNLHTPISHFTPKIFPVYEMYYKTLGEMYVVLEEISFAMWAAPFWGDDNHVLGLSLLF